MKIKSVYTANQLSRGDGVALKLHFEHETKMFLVHPGDEVFFALNWFPYHKDLELVLINPKTHGLHFIGLQLQANKEDWSLEPKLACKLNVFQLVFRDGSKISSILF